jgi:aminoglycoside phosphotransferase (APT) family kinase protein
MLPPQVLDLLSAAFPGESPRDIGPTVGGFSNLTLKATLGGRRCVIKAATTPMKREDVRREARVLALLRGQGLPIPELLGMREDADWTVAITGALGGELGLRVLEHAPEALEGVFGALGRVLAAVHAVPRAADDPALLLAERARGAREVLGRLDLPADLRAMLAASLDHAAWHSPPVCLAHGDAGLHNLLWDGRITALLDWEWSGWGNPLLDLAWLHWTLRWRDLPLALWRTFLAGYGDGAAIRQDAAPEAMRALVFGQIASILARVQDQPPARAEWLRRLEWTRALAFPGLAA